jgi:flagellar biosynthesis GTPase FlhF
MTSNDTKLRHTLTYHTKPRQTMPHDDKRYQTKPSDAECVCKRSIFTLCLPSTTAGKLVEYPPLAVLANTFVEAVNNLRHCCPFSMCSQILTEAEDTLRWAGTILQQRNIAALQDLLPASLDHSQGRNGDATKEGDIKQELILLARAMADLLVPYVGKLLKDMFHQTGPTEELLDVERILEPLDVLFREERAANERAREEKERQEAKERLRLQQDSARVEQIAADKRRQEEVERRKKEEKQEADERARQTEKKAAEKLVTDAASAAEGLEANLLATDDMAPTPEPVEPAEEIIVESDVVDVVAEQPKPRASGMSLKAKPKGKAD